MNTRHGDTETRRHGDRGGLRWLFSASPRLRVSASLAALCLCFAASAPAATDGFNLPTTPYTRAWLRISNQVQAALYVGNATNGINWLSASNLTYLMLSDYAATNVVNETTVRNIVNNLLTTFVTSNQIDSAFTICVLPDTQYLTETTNGAGRQVDWVTARILYTNMFNRLLTRRSEYNIQAVVGVGDVVNDAQPDQMSFAVTGFQILGGTSGIPFLVSVGNHDGPPNYTNWDTWFPPSLYTTNTWWHGAFYTNSTRNSYLPLTNGVTKLLLLSLEYGAATGPLAWASNAARTYLDHHVIVLTHAYLLPDGRRSSLARGDPYTWAPYTDGVGLWEHFKRWPNLAMVLCGHQLDGVLETNNLVQGVAGNWVNQVFCNHQYEDLYLTGDAGCVKYLTCHPDGRIQARTWSENGAKWLEAYTHVMESTSSGPSSAPALLAGQGVTLLATNDDRNLLVSITGFSGVTSAGVNDPYLCLPLGGTNLPVDLSSSRWSVTGTVANATAGLDGSALCVTTNALVIPDSGFSTGGLTNLSASIWFCKTNFTGIGEIAFGKYYSATYGEWFLGFSSFELAWAVVNASSNRTKINTSGWSAVATNGAWHHALGTFNGTELHLYVDGALVASGSHTGATLNAAQSRCAIGAAQHDTYAPTGLYNSPGLWDDAKVWKRVISPNEVAEEYRRGWLHNSLFQGTVSADRLIVHSNLTADTFTGNGRGLTNLLATAALATNAPTNGDALRYTNGTFYWAP